MGIAAQKFLALRPEECKTACAVVLSLHIAHLLADRPMGARRGVTLTESLAVVMVLGCLTATFLPALLDAKDAAERTICARNLAHLGQAMILWAGEHDGFLPDCGAASPFGGAVPKDGHHFPSRFDAPGTCVWPDVRAVGNQANLWLLVHEGYTDAQLFVCPATPDKPSLNASGDAASMGFLAMDPATGRATPPEDYFLKRVAAGRCSYSYQNQFAHPATDPAVSDPRNATTHRHLHPADLAILADRSPYTRPQLTRQFIVSPDAEPEANSPNHHGRGQNVLYLEGYVQWQATPRCGAVRPGGACDNIYWPDAGRPDDPENVPRSVWDSFLVP